MSYLTRAASRDLFRLIRESHITGLIGWTEARDRLASLRDMCDQSDPTGLAAQRGLIMNEQEAPPVWSDSPIPEPTTETGAINGQEFDDPLLYYVSLAVPALRSWVFIVGDPDPYPSVPHGHWRRMPKPKLDPYLGWIYDGTRQIRRESRRNIILLWNEQSFRTFAQKSVTHFIAQNPRFTWRVRNPGKMPRARRP